MRRTAGWSVLAVTALEIAALALTCRFIGGRRSQGDLAQAQPVAKHVRPDEAPLPQTPVQETPQSEREPLTFLETDGEAADEYYRAVDVSGELIVAFYADGRVRLTGPERGFAGILQDGQADLLDVTDNTWSELFVRATPEGGRQLELRGGVYGGRIFACEPIAAPASHLSA
ncbi:MAG TPA: hypothetical protein VFE17_06555 [Candidatus Baltobacteraceae bacterium]|jgi:hypothetical protein|nr:hypothetical protein [Candidatus Baltobacteraceae bacterium]